MASSAEASLTQTPHDPVSSTLRAKFQDNHIIPLWESGTQPFTQPTETAFTWPWSTMRPLMLETADIKTPSILERRVMMMVNPTIPHNDWECCSGLVSAGIQALMPGEVARPHRHSMHALRFVLEGQGAETIVEGKPCAMEPGDLVITPAWTWHEHHNKGGLPTLWVDMLDFGIQRALRTDAFQPGPPSNMVAVYNDDAFASVAMLPVGSSARSQPSYSPIFRYPWAATVQAVQAAPLDVGGARTVRYVNPLTGGAVLPTIDCYLRQLEQDSIATYHSTSESQVCVVVEGQGESRIGDQVISWAPHDVFTIPRGQSAEHRCTSGPARIFIATDGEIYRRMGALDRPDHPAS